MADVAPEGTYVVIAKSTDDYEVLRDLEVNGDRAKAVADGFHYASDSNSEWIDGATLLGLVES